MKFSTTACPRNCYSSCTLKVQVEDGRLRRIEPHPENRATPEGACLKGLSYVERQHSPDRLLHPLRKVPGTDRFERISWETAIDSVASELVRLRETHGPQSVLYYSASGSKGLLNAAGVEFWRLYGGCTTTYGDLCWPAGLVALGLSTLHLGRKGRAWRAMLNLRRSWLRREVVLFPAFLLLTGAAAIVGSAAGSMTRAAVVTGFVALYAMDRVYGVSRTPGLAVHSAQLLLTGLLFAGLIAPNATLAVSVAILKIVLYVARKARSVREGRPSRPLWSALRISLLFAAWITPTSTDPLLFRAGVLIAVAASEWIDRAEYYVELDPPAPGKQLAEDLTQTAGHSSRPQALTAKTRWT